MRFLLHKFLNIVLKRAVHDLNFLWLLENITVIRVARKERLDHSEKYK